MACLGSFVRLRLQGSYLSFQQLFFLQPFSRTIQHFLCRVCRTSGLFWTPSSLVVTSFASFLLWPGFFFESQKFDSTLLALFLVCTPASTGRACSVFAFASYASSATNRLLPAVAPFLSLSVSVHSSTVFVFSDMATFSWSTSVWVFLPEIHGLSIVIASHRILKPFQPARRAVKAANDGEP